MGASLKEDPLAGVSTPEEAITTGVVVADAPKEKSAADVEEVSSFFSSPPFSPETYPVPPLMSE